MDSCTPFNFIKIISCNLRRPWLIEPPTLPDFNQALLFSLEQHANAKPIPVKEQRFLQKNTHLTAAKNQYRYVLARYSRHFRQTQRDIHVLNRLYGGAFQKIVFRSDDNR